ncbi:MAG: hypothetical protein ABSG95_08995 [Solirubrobacteraceae bacterium]
MTRVGVFLGGLWEFVVGDDWRTAFGVVLALAVTAVLADAGISAWWVMPPTVLALLALSIRRAARSASRHAGRPNPDGVGAIQHDATAFSGERS